MIRPAPVAARTAFTLIEVVVAAALVAFLLATMLAAIRLVYATEEVGQDELLLFRTGGGLLDAMQRDLDGAIRMIDPAGADDISATLAAADGSDAGDTATTAAGIDPALSMMRDRVVGSGDLLLSVAAPRRPATEYAAPATDQLPLSASARLRRVHWYMGDEGLIRDAQTTDADGGWVLLDSVTDTTTRAIGVRFFDGAEWVDSWDGVAAGVDPVAVEVTLTLGVDDTPKEIVMSRVMPVAAGRYAVPAETSEATDALDSLDMLELGF